MKHEITSDGIVFEVIARGAASPKGFIELFQDVINKENWSPQCCLIVDYTQLSDFNPKKMDFNGISSVAAFLKKNGNSFKGTKVATLLRDTMNSKIVAGLMGSVNDFYGSDIKHDIFIDHNEAVDWLKQK